VEFVSERAAGLGLPRLPIYEPLPAPRFPLVFRQGRTLTQFHGFYDHGQALPTLHRLDPEPKLWMAPEDARARGVDDGAPIRIYNERGDFHAHAQVTARVPAGTVWMRDGWTGLNRLTDGEAVLPDGAVDVFGFSGGQASFDASVEVERA
jgi:anaerobic selenocysteine-containing dehydrogenase